MIFIYSLNMIQVLLTVLFLYRPALGQSVLPASPYPYWQPSVTSPPVYVNYSDYQSQQTRPPAFANNSPIQLQNQHRRVVDRRPQLPFISERYSPPNTNLENSPIYPPPYPDKDFALRLVPPEKYPYWKPEYPDKNYNTQYPVKRPGPNSVKPTKPKKEWSWSRFKPYIRRPPESIDKIIDGGLLLGFIPIRSLISVTAVWSLVYWQLSRTTTPVVRLRKAGDDEAMILKKDAKLWIDLLLQTWLLEEDSWSHEECLKRALCEMGQDYLHGLAVPTWVDNSVKSMIAAKGWSEVEDFWDTVTNKGSQDCREKYDRCPWSMKKLFAVDGVEAEKDENGL